ncbi:hypothetical protein HDK90DRAFT_497281 [Phyllosticta capitalensis]|uniref:Secreted protein n=1 Tax=Phyllosticta capitalensis TaxID=121624 RepID=A0ABR1YBP8_9PEZI
MAVLLCFALFCFALLYGLALLHYSAFWSFSLNRRLLPPLPFPPSPRWTYPSIYPSVYLSIRPSTHLSNCLSVCLSIRRSSSPHSFARALPLPLSDIFADGMAWRMDEAAELIPTCPVKVVMSWVVSSLPTNILLCLNSCDAPSIPTRSHQRYLPYTRRLLPAQAPCINKSHHVA